MNRRTFIVAAIAALSIPTHRAFGQTMEQISGRTAVSKLTGAVIDLGDTGFSLYGRLMDDRNDKETLGFSSDTCDGAVRFIPAGTDVAAYLDDRADRIAVQMETTEVVGMDEFEDGGWMGLSVQTETGKDRSMYIEVQLGAFPGYDLEVVFTADSDTLEDDFELFQRIQVESLEPFLFAQESEMPSMLLTSTPNSRGSASSRSTSSGRSRGEEGSTAPETVVESVRVHQARFMDELDTFYGVIDRLTDEGATSENEMTLFTDLLDLMFAWIVYPDDANALLFPAELSSLESAYFEWSDGVGEMGATMSDWMVGGGEIDAFLDAIDVAVQLNSVLSAELRTLGVIIKPVGRGSARPYRNHVTRLNTYLPARNIA